MNRRKLFSEARRCPAGLAALLIALAVVVSGCGGGGGGGGELIVMAQSVFGDSDETQPARLAILEPGALEEGGWKEIAVIEDPDSNVFHNALPFEGANDDKGILTIAGDKAKLVLWMRSGDSFTPKVLGEWTFGGTFNRLRDIGVGDTDGDGVDEIVIATHDQGTTLLIEQEGGEYKARELARQHEFVHEIELGDIDGDGELEIFATPTAKNVTGKKEQPGDIVMFDHQPDGSYKTVIVEHFPGRHAKEILFDVWNGEPVIFTALEGEGSLGGAVGGASSEIRMYRYKDGAFEGEDVYALPGKLCRFLNAGDTDGDGKRELIASTARNGIYLKDDGSWARKRIARGTHSAGFEHATILLDLDGDGTLEVLAASDDDSIRKLQAFRYNKEKRTYDRIAVLSIEQSGFYWNLTVIPKGFH